MCLYPKLIKNPRYKATKKNRGIVPICNDERKKIIPIGCGKCMVCTKQRARGWKYRIIEDLKVHKNAKFITLTFKPEALKKLNEEKIEKLNENTRETEEINISELKGYAKDNAIATRAVRLFLERWRKKYKKSLRHWMVTEIGGTHYESLHIHGIVWTDDLDEVEKIWQYGHIWKGKKVNEQTVNYVNERTASYIIKYMTKIDEKHKE